MTGSNVKPAIPTRCSFNLDATPIYLSIATIFLAHQRRPLVRPELTVLGVLMLTSKGAAGVTSSGSIVLASTSARAFDAEQNRRALAGDVRLKEDAPILPQPLAISEQPTG